jgi:hypothetical protein
VAARDPLLPEQQLAHHRPDPLLLWEADEPDHAEDVTAVIDRKLAPSRRTRASSVDDEGP